MRRVTCTRKGELIYLARVQNTEEQQGEITQEVAATMVWLAEGSLPSHIDTAKLTGIIPVRVW